MKDEAQPRMSRLATTQELEEISSSCYQFVPKNPEKPHERDSFGRPKERVVRDDAIYYSARLQLKANYDNWDLSPAERAEAGRALNISEYGIAAHEALHQARVRAEEMALTLPRAISSSLGI